MGLLLLALSAWPAAAAPTPAEDRALMGSIQRRFDELRVELSPQIEAFDEFRDRYAREGPSRALEAERDRRLALIHDAHALLQDLADDFKELRHSSRIRMVFTAVEGVTGAGLSGDAVGTAAALMTYEDFREQLFQLNTRIKESLADEEKAHAAALAAARFRRRWQLGLGAGLTLLVALAWLARRRSRHNPGSLAANGV